MEEKADVIHVPIAGPGEIQQGPEDRTPEVQPEGLRPAQLIVPPRHCLGHGAGRLLSPPEGCCGVDRVRVPRWAVPCLGGKPETMGGVEALTAVRTADMEGLL